MVRRRPSAALPLAALVALAASPPVLAQDTRPGVAVWEFESGGSYGDDALDTQLLGVGVQQQLATELAQNPAIRVVERSRIREILNEQDLAAEGRVDAATAARVGRLVGARYMVLGSFIEMAGRMQMSARIVDVETSEVLHGLSVRAPRDEMFELLVELASRITEEVDLPPLAGAIREQREAREIPPEALTLYARAQLYQEEGQRELAVSTYERIARDFPQYTEAQEALRQLSVG